MCAIHKRDFMSPLIVGGDSAEVFRQRMTGTTGRVEHWSGRKHRDLVRTIPKTTEAVVVVLDRVSHAPLRSGCGGRPIAEGFQCIF